MKILHVITSLKIGGAEKLITDLVPLLRMRGCTIEVLLFDGIDTFLKEILRKQNILIIEFSCSGNVYSISNLLNLRKIINKYDIVHSHNTACQYFVALAAVTLYTRPILVTTEHSTDNRRRKILFFRYLDKWMYHSYDAIISISEKTSLCLQNYLDEQLGNLYTINNGINLKTFEAVNSVVINDSRFKILMVAGFRQEKDQDTLIRAMVHLGKDYVLWLVGDGTRKTECENIVIQLDLKEQVLFWGVRKDVPAILKAADVVVMSSHWEGFGLAAVEGMVAHKPVIASNVPGLAEVVGGAGLLFDSGDEQDLAKKIVLLFKDKEKYMEIAEACFIRSQQFDINIMVDKYYALYQYLIKKRV